MSDYQMLGDLSLKNLLDRFEKNVFKKLNCVKIGKIKTFYSDQQNADIQIDGYPLISGVPVSFIFGGDFSIQVPVKEGDDCIVLFCDGDLDNWVEGKGYVPAYSQDKHGLNGAVALVGITNLNNKVSDYIKDGVRVKYKGTILDLKDDKITVNKNVEVDGDLIVSGDVKATGDVVAGTISLKNHIHPGVESGSSKTGTPQ